MQLSRRLKTVAHMVSSGNIVADIGCDHAYSSIYLVENETAPAVIAMDINKGPLKRAMENVEKYGYSNKIEIRQSDGAKALIENEVDTLLIGGMGGSLIHKILLDSNKVVKTVKELILQPQSEIDLVRRYLHTIQFRIVDEEMIIDEGKYYVIIKAVPGNESYQKEIFYLYGKKLLESKNESLLDFLEYGKKKRVNLIDSLKEQNSAKSHVRLLEIENELQFVEEGLDYFK